MSGAAEFELTAADNVAAYRTHTGRLSGWIGVLFLDVSAVLAALDIRRHLSIFADWNFWMVTAIGLWFLLWEFVVRDAITRRQFRQSQAMRSALRVRWDDEGLSIDTDTSQARFEWGQFFRWMSSKTTLMLYRDAGFFIPIPRRAVGDAAIDDMIAALVGAHVKRLRR